MKLFLRNNIAFTKKCTVDESISCRIFFLLLCGCIQKQPFGGASESTSYSMMRKAFKNSSREVHFQLGRSLQACNVDKNKLVHGYFSIILTTLQETFHSCSHFFKTIIYMISSDGCFCELFLTNLRKILQLSFYLFIESIQQIQIHLNFVVHN